MRPKQPGEVPADPQDPAMSPTRPQGNLLRFPKSDPWTAPRWRPVRVPRLPATAGGVRTLERVVLRFARRGWRLLRALDAMPGVGMEDLEDGPVLTFLALDGAWLDLLCHLARHEVTPGSLDDYATDVRRLGREQTLLREAIFDSLPAELREPVAAAEQQQWVDPLEVQQAVADMVLAFDESSDTDPSRDPDFPGPSPAQAGQLLPLAEVNATRRSEWEARPLPAKGGLLACLRSLPVDWLDGVCAALGVTADGRRRHREVAVATLLKRPEVQGRLVASLSVASRAALMLVLEREGRCSARAVTSVHGSDRHDAWFWREHPPGSPLGQLRRAGLVFVGQEDLGVGHERVVLVPTELRGTLASILGGD